MNDDFHERLAPLRGRHYGNAEHKRELREELRQRVGHPTRPRPLLPRWSVCMGLFAAGATTAVAAVAVSVGFPAWNVTLEGPDRTRQKVTLRPLQSNAPPLRGILSTEDGQRYRVESADGEFTIRLIGDADEEQDR